MLRNFLIFLIWNATTESQVFFLIVNILHLINLKKKILSLNQTENLHHFSVFDTNEKEVLGVLNSIKSKFYMVLATFLISLYYSYMYYKFLNADSDFLAKIITRDES